MGMEGTNLNQTELCSLETILDSYVAQKTSVALSSLLGESVSHSIKRTRAKSNLADDLKNFGKELVVCSVFLYGAGDIRLGILYSIPENDAKLIAAKLTCMEKIDSLDELGKSAISEVGNIMSGSFFNALTDHTGLKVDLSTPDFSITSVSSLLEPRTGGFSCPTNGITTEIELQGANSGVCVHMLIIQDHDNARKLLKGK